MKKIFMKWTAVSMFLFFFSPVIFCQNVGIGTNTPHASALLDIQSTNKGVSLPSMTTAQRKNINDPKVGLLVFDTDKNTVFMYDGGQWLALLFTVSTSNIPPIIRTASDGEIGDQFGYTVAVSGNYAVIGAPYDNAGANTDQGSVYIFFRNNAVWSEQAKLVASDGAAGDRFGHSVSISGNYVLVGSPYDNTTANDAGSAYVFLRSGTTWTEQAKLTASNAAASDNFGWSVSINSAYAVIGALGDDIGSNISEGSAYFFHRSGVAWTQEDNVVAPFGDTGDRFGSSVSISGDYAVVGAPEDDVAGNQNQGSAHVFHRVGANWDYHGALEDSNATVGDAFGYSVSIDGNYAIVGVPNSSSYGGSKACIFLRNGAVWDLQASLVAQPVVFSAPQNSFGYSVSIDGDYVIIGAPRADIGENIRVGAAYVFKRDGTNWIFVRRINDQAPTGVDDRMGNCVAVSGFNVLVGSPGPEALKGRIFFMNIE